MLIHRCLLFGAGVFGCTSAAQSWYNSSSVRNGLVTANNTGPRIDCQSALISWSSETSRLASTFNSTFTLYWQVPHTISYGNARNVSVLDGITRAHDSPDITSTSIQIAAHSQLVTNLITLPGTSLPKRPQCTIDPASCTKLWDEYARAMGLSGNSTLAYVPATSIIPNSPRCQIGGSTAVCYTRRHPKSLMDPNWKCSIKAADVKVFFFPLRNDTVATKPPRTVVTQGITMTSPSVYLYYNKITAEMGGAEWRGCQNNTQSEPRFWTTEVGEENTGHWYSELPQSLSTIEKAFVRNDWPYTALDIFDRMNPSNTPQSFPEAALTAMAKANASDYSFWAGVIYTASSAILNRPLDLRELTSPGPRAYYLRPRAFSNGHYTYAYGCHPKGPHHHCHTIFDHEYHAQFSIPPGFHSLHPEWSDCAPYGEGSYDPPVALEEVASAVQPTETRDAPPTSPAAQPSSTPHDPTPVRTQSPPATTSALSAAPVNVDKLSQTSTSIPESSNPPVANAKDVLTEPREDSTSDMRSSGGSIAGISKSSIANAKDALTQPMEGNNDDMRSSGGFDTMVMDANDHLLLSLTKPVPGSVTASLSSYNVVVVAGQTIKPGAVVTVHDQLLSRPAELDGVLVAMPISSGGKASTVAVSSGHNTILIGAQLSGTAVAKVVTVLIVDSTTTSPSHDPVNHGTTIAMDKPGSLVFVNGTAVPVTTTRDVSHSTTEVLSTDLAGHILDGLTPDQPVSSSSSRAIYTGAAARTSWPNLLVKFAFTFSISWHLFTL